MRAETPFYRMSRRSSSCWERYESGWACPCGPRLPGMLLVTRHSYSLLHSHRAQGTRQKFQLLLPCHFESGQMSTGAVRWGTLVHASIGADLHNRYHRFVNGIGQRFIKKSALNNAQRLEVILH